MSKYIKKDKYAVVAEHKGENSELTGRMKTLELNHIKAMFLKDAEVKLRVKNDSKVKPTRIVEGKVIQKNGFLVAIKTAIRVESFQYLDFLTKRAWVI